MSDGLFPRRAKIVCTLGPSCNTEEDLRQMLLLGMDVARLNFSHGTHAEHLARIKTVRRVAAKLGRSVAILQDLQGPKIRTSRLKDHQPVELKSGARVTITNHDIEGTAERLGTTFRTLAREAAPGTMILLSDGRLSLRVLRVQGDDVLCEVVDGGMLGEHQGINLPGAVLSVPSLTAKDKKDLKFGLEAGVDLVAISFVRSAKDVKAVQRIIAAAGKDTPVIAKLEKPQAIENLDEILEVAGGVMVARGDLGVEMPPEQVPIIQKHVIRRAQRWRKPVITATQMLDSMIQNPRPTRAEASDVANAIIDGTDAVMLSGETAAGAFPVRAVEMMRRIAGEVEAGIDFKTFPARRRTEAEALSEAANVIAQTLRPRCIVVLTASGHTARAVAAERSKTPVVALTADERVYRALNLFWGIEPVLAPADASPDASFEHLVGQAEAVLRDRGLVASGDRVLIIGGIPAGTPRGANFVKIHAIG